MEHYYILYNTENALYLKCSDEGDPIVHYVEEKVINPWDLFPEVKDPPTLMNVVEVLDPVGVKQSKRLDDMIPDYYAAETTEILTLPSIPSLAAQTVIKVKVGILKYADIFNILD